MEASGNSYMQRTEWRHQKLGHKFGGTYIYLDGSFRIRNKRYRT